MKDRIPEILAVAYRIHNETDFCVFIRFSGHVNHLEIEIDKSIKNYDTTIVKFSCVTFQGRGMYKRQKKNAKREIETLKRLKDILKKRKIKLEKYRCTNDQCPHFCKYDKEWDDYFYNCGEAENLSDVLGCYGHKYKK